MPLRIIRSGGVRRVCETGFALLAVFCTLADGENAMDTQHPFDRAVAEYVAGLTDARRQVLQSGVLSPLSARHWPLYLEVIDRYSLRDAESPVRRDINERVAPDPQGAHGLLWGRGGPDPIFEALTFLSAVQRALR